MLNNPFKNKYLNEELEFVNDNLMINECFSNINEADEESEGKSFFEKMKKFFKDLLEAIQKAIRKFVNFFTNAFKKLIFKDKKVNEYINENKEKIEDKKFSKKEIIKVRIYYTYNEIKRNIEIINKLDPESESFNKDLKKAKIESLEKDREFSHFDIDSKGALVFALAEAAKRKNLIKEQAKKFKDNSDKSSKSAKNGISAAEKKDKKQIKREKKLAKNYNKKASFNRKICNRLLFDTNKILLACYQAMKKMKKELEE